MGNSPRYRYYNDAQFATLVNLMISHITQCHYTPSEMRDAAMLASILYESTHVRRYLVPPNSELEGALKLLWNWMDKNETEGA